ncbi:hypothetical protein XGA_0778 [Xanthomonas hortorum ATCC 19865]|nr:hypothetical protein XGA_0778 [Xanthomonas hortorum ATCC 19865]
MAMAHPDLRFGATNGSMDMPGARAAIHKQSQYALEGRVQIGSGQANLMSLASGFV